MHMFRDTAIDEPAAPIIANLFIIGDLAIYYGIYYLLEGSLQAMVFPQPVFP